MRVSKAPPLGQSKFEAGLQFALNDDSLDRQICFAQLLPATNLRSVSSFRQTVNRLRSYTAPGVGLLTHEF